MIFKRYYYCQIYRYLRFIKKGIEVIKNKILGRSNLSPLLGYRTTYYQLNFVNEFQTENAYYGLSKMFKDYAGYKGLIPANIEHGIYFDENNFELLKYDLPCVITSGNDRFHCLSKMTDKPVFTVGPYILYKESMISQCEYSKSKLGRTALVFPAHSIENIEIGYEVDSFIQFIEDARIKLNINTILVSLYFKDIPDFAAKYEEKGYIVISSGHRNDPEFLDRQLAYFKMSDFVFTNGVGTHIGFAVALNKPVSYYDQRITRTAADDTNESKILTFSRKEAEDRNIKCIINTFSGLHSSISIKQREIVKLYWGTDKFRSPEQIKKILTSAHDIFSQSKHSNKSYHDLYIEYAEKSHDPEIKNLIYEALGRNQESIYE